MGIESIQIGGMERHSNATDAGIGSCEELINIASESGSLKIKGRKKAVSGQIAYEQIHIHEIALQKNYIGRTDNAIVLFDKDLGTTIQSIHAVSKNNEVYIASLNNMLVISDKTEIKTYVYLWESGAYKTFFNGVGSINIPLTMDITASPFVWLGAKVQEDISADSNKSIANAINAVINKFKAEHKNYTEGFFLVLVNFTLFDNSEVFSRNITLVPSTVTKPIVDDFTIISKVTTGGDGKITYTTDFNFDLYYNSYGVSITTTADMSAYKDLIKSVNLYVSRPISNMGINEDKIITNINPSIATSISYPSIGISQSGIEKTLFYRQKSWSIDELDNGIFHYLEFGVDSQTAEKTLEVENSWVERAGQMMLYNRRIHFFDSKVRTHISEILLNQMTIFGTPFTADVYVYLRTNTKSVVIKKSGVTLYTSSSTEPYTINISPMVIVPDSRAYKIIIQTATSSAEVSLTPSPAYNYAYAFTSGTIEMQTGVADITPDNTYEESNTINVTALDNPIYFPVEHSYAFAGNIIDVGIATEQISESQIGMYPVNVFTDKGIYALQQGEGAILYGNIIPINTDVCTGDVLQSRNGLIYIANNNIYLLHGRRNLCISTLIDGPIDYDIRNNESYSLCCNDDRTYNVTDNLSNLPFKEYLQGAQLSYSPEEDELIVSNPSKKYSYVFSFIHKSWHKVTETYSEVSNNLLLRPVFTNQASAKAAVGKVRLTNLVVASTKIIQSYAYAEFTSGDDMFYESYNCNPGDRMALIVADKQVSSAQFAYRTNIAIIAAVLCRDIDYLEDDCTGNSLKFYSLDSSKAQGQDYIQIINLTTGHTLTTQFVNKSETAEVNMKGLADVPSVNVNGYGGGAIVSAGSSIITLVNDIVDSFNANPNVNTIAVASAIGNEITLTALTPGSVGNNLTIFAGGDIGAYVQFEVDPFSGGAESTQVAGEYSEIIDYSLEEENVDRKIHIQTRPFSLGNKNAYTTLHRTILNVKAALSQNQLLSFYLYASSNLTDWKCVAGAQKKNCDISDIRLNRVARSYKYFVIMIGGTVSSDTCISNILLDSNIAMPGNIR